MHLGMANQGGSSSVLREYRKGNWTVQETMVLIEAKKMDDERRLKRVGDQSEGGRSKPAELRWKWVEDYCWRNGCLRSQNQCNDKWDNLMRDFKKVRDYERKLLGERGEGGNVGEGSYWKIERNGRKERNLPSNMLPQIYEALVEVVERKGSGQRSMVVGGDSGGGYCSNFQPTLPPLLQHSVSNQVALVPLPPPPPPLPPPPLPEQPPQTSAQPHPIPYSQPTVDSDTSEYSDSPAKRRRRGGGDGTSGTARSGTPNEVGSAISKSASIIAEAIQACEEREERRHKDLLSLHERRLQIEESKTEISKQGLNGLVDAINKLANSIFALASQKDQQTSK